MTLSDLSLYVVITPHNMTLSDLSLYVVITPHNMTLSDLSLYVVIQFSESVVVLGDIIPLCSNFSIKVL